MLEAKQYRGQWWLPEKPDHIVAGILSYDPKSGISVNLSGALGDRNFAPHDFHLVFGIVRDPNVRVTLCDCFVVEYTLNLPGFDTQVLRAQRVFFGAHLNERTDFEWPICEIEIEGLSEWSALSAIVPIDTSKCEPSDLHMAYGCRFVPPFTACLDSHTRLSLSVLPGGSFSRDKVLIEQRVTFSLEADSPIHVDQWLDQYIEPLRDFITLASDSDTPATNIEFTRSAEDTRAEKQHVRLLFQPSAHSLTKPSTHGMLFRLDDIRSDFADRVEHWMRVAQQYRRSRDVFFSSVYRLSAFIELKYASVLHALILYAADRESRAKDSTAPFSLFSAPAIRTTLEHLYAKVAVAHKFLPLKDDFVANAIRVLRFILFREEPVKPSAIDIYWGAEQLALIGKILYLREIGIDDRRISAWMQMSQRIQRIGNMARQSRTSSGSA